MDEDDPAALWLEPEIHPPKLAEGARDGVMLLLWRKEQ
jgi:hypothetical protein